MALKIIRDKVTNEVLASWEPVYTPIPEPIVTEDGEVVAFMAVGEMEVNWLSDVVPDGGEDHETEVLLLPDEDQVKHNTKIVNAAARSQAVANAQSDPDNRRLLFNGTTFMDDQGTITVGPPRPRRLSGLEAVEVGLRRKNKKPTDPVTNAELLELFDQAKKGTIFG